MTEYHIGVDSTDSAELGMCTTYLGALIIEEMEKLPVELSTYPELVRLNPNVPWKTRGNGAVALRFSGRRGQERRMFDTCCEMIEKYSIMEDPQTNPGLVVISGNVPEEFTETYHEALHRLMGTDEIIPLLKEHECLFRGWKNGRGLIGAVSAVGARFDEFTYEAILYRNGEVKDRERLVDPESVREASRKHPSTFFNVDDRGDLVCIPHSPCPVICGIRGLEPVDTRSALLEVSAGRAERWVLWRTNQHTDVHIVAIDSLKDASPYSSVSLDVVVDSEPSYHGGGHLSIPVRDGSGHTMTAWAYEPTKGFRKELSGLIRGDSIRIWGSVREGGGRFERGINLEKVEVQELEKKRDLVNPRCPLCGGPTESMGKGQGLRCKSCGNREGLEKLPMEVKRKLSPGMIEPPPTAWRHLFRPSSVTPVKELEVAPPFHGLLFEAWCCNLQDRK